MNRVRPLEHWSISVRLFCVYVVLDISSGFLTCWCPHPERPTTYLYDYEIEKGAWAQQRAVEPLICEWVLIRTLLVDYCLLHWSSSDNSTFRSNTPPPNSGLRNAWNKKPAEARGSQSLLWESQIWHVLKSFSLQGRKASLPIAV
jgi:hypothetical protein